jgi:hypothetical protein
LLSRIDETVTHNYTAIYTVSRSEKLGRRKAPEVCSSVASRLIRAPRRSLTTSTRGVEFVGIAALLGKGGEFRGCLIIGDGSLL